MKLDKVILTPEEAISLLIDGAKLIHNFANPGSGILVGCDYKRSEAIKAIKEAHAIEIGGEGCKKMGHGLAVWRTPKDVTFFEADEGKVEAMEKAKANV